MGKGGPKEIVLTSKQIAEVKTRAACGLTDEEIWLMLGIGHSTFYRLKRDNQELSDAIKEGRARGIADISNRLYEEGMKGNITAMIFYLKCRANWRETNVHEVVVKTHEQVLKELE